MTASRSARCDDRGRPPSRPGRTERSSREMPRSAATCSWTRRCWSRSAPSSASARTSAPGRRRKDARCRRRSSRRSERRRRRFPVAVARASPARGVGSVRRDWVEIGTSAATRRCGSRSPRASAELPGHVRDPSRESEARSRDLRARRGRRPVELREGDAIAGLDADRRVSFCFLDAEKDVYLSCWRKLASKLVPGALVLADNVISHRDEMTDFLAAVEADREMDRWWCRSAWACCWQGGRGAGPGHE